MVIGGSPTSDQTSSSQHQNGQNDQIHQDDSSNSRSTTDGAKENNSENVIDDATADFGPYSNANGFFDPTSKTTVSYARKPVFPQSREEANKVSKERAVLFVDSVLRTIKGRHGLDVKVPLFIKDESSWLMYVHVNYRKDIIGILYNTETGKVSLSGKALSATCSSADTGVELKPSEIEKMDGACLEFLKSKMRLHQEKEEQESEEGEKLS